MQGLAERNAQVKAYAEGLGGGHERSLFSRILTVLDYEYTACSGVVFCNCQKSGVIPHTEFLV